MSTTDSFLSFFLRQYYLGKRISKALNYLFGPNLDLSLGAASQGLCKAVGSVLNKVQSGDIIPSMKQQGEERQNNKMLTGHLGSSLSIG